MKNLSRIKTLIFLVVITVIASIALTFVVELTKDKRLAQEQFKIMKLICASANMKPPFTTPKQALDFAKSCPTFKHDKIDLLAIKCPEPATALLFTFPGLWGRIKAVMTVAPGITDRGFKVETIKGLRIINHKETPGLGGRIEEQTFLDQFKNFKREWPLKILMTGKPDKPGEIQGITGATQTCSFLKKGILDMLIQLENEFKGGLK